MANGEKVKKWIPGGVALGSAIGAFAGVKALAEVPPWVQTLIADRGLDYVFSFAILGLLAMFVPSFVRTQKDQAVAMTSVAESLRGLPQKDEMKFESILIGQEMLHREVKRLHDRFDAIAEKIHGQAG